MAQVAAPAVTSRPSAALIARLTRDQGPEQEQTLTWNALNVVSTPTAIRTDRKIRNLLFHFRGRITNAGTGPTLRTAPPLLGTQLFALIQQITLRGQHQTFGAQTPIIIRGETAAEYFAILYPNYTPFFTVAQNGGAPVRSQALDVTAAHTNDVEFVLPVPLFPPGINANDVPFYCIHGPDWPGNLYVDILFADGTALATANPPTTFTAYGSGSGSPIVNILSERPLLGKNLSAAIKPAITFRVHNFAAPTNAVVNTGGVGVKLTDLIVGKDTTRIFLKTGTQGAGESAGVVAYGTLSDLIVTRSFPALDVRNLGFQLGDAPLQDYMGRDYGRVIPIGYKMVRDFISTPGVSTDANPKGAFPSSQLTAARKWELDGDVTAAANQIAEVVQEMTLGRPSLNGVPV
jgi:hypothetical protein